MNYQETLNYLLEKLPMYQRIGEAAYTKNLDTTFALDKYFGCTHKQFKSVHIAGTNGKGSVAHGIASILQEAGYKVGLHTSPHYKDFRERIKINGAVVTKKFVVDFIDEHKDFLDDLKPSFFEITVMMAFEYFATNSIDIAIIETGMGGRLDSTNILEPELSVITNIDLDHTQFLGNTIEEIAEEKAGIIKQKVPVVLGTNNKEVVEIVNIVASEKESPVFIAPDKFIVKRISSSNKNSIKILKNKRSFLSTINLDLLGEYQLENIQTVIQSIIVLKKNYSIKKEDIQVGLSKIKKNTKIMGRWQILNNSPLTICDSGHNEAGIKVGMKQIKELKYKKLHFIFGLVQDKPIDKILDLLPTDAEYYFTQANIPRALDCDELQEKAKKIGLSGKSYKTVRLAYLKAKNNASINDLIYVGGSVFVVAEVL